MSGVCVCAGVAVGVVSSFLCIIIDVSFSKINVLVHGPRGRGLSYVSLDLTDLERASQHTGGGGVCVCTVCLCV